MSHFFSTSNNGSNKFIGLFGDWASPLKKSILSVNGSINLINLEGPVLGLNNILNKKKINKAGPHILNSYLPDSDKDFIFTLSNNHLFDYGLTGYEETIKRIKQKKWNFVGAGLSKKKAIKPLIFQFQDKRIGVVSRCETQFGIAQEDTPGVAAFDFTIYEQIRKLKKETDIVIASIHAAAEMLPWPSPKRQDSWRALIDAGADIVHGHHAHVPQGWEKYRGGLIFYGLGNFCVDPAKWSWHPNGLWSLAPEIYFQDNQLKMRLKTMVIKEHDHLISIRESRPKECLVHRKYLNICIKPLTNRLLLEGLWQEASVSIYQKYFLHWLGFNITPAKATYQFLRSSVGKLIKKLKKKDGAAQQVNLLRYHLFACDSHNDVISTALGLLSGELKDLRNKKTEKLVSKWMIYK
jgi:poly-gamma-glutamate synthesis protein (capsule biosynthesis protein)